MADKYETNIVIKAVADGFDKSQKAIEDLGKYGQKSADELTRMGGDFSKLGGNLNQLIGIFESSTARNMEFATSIAKVENEFQHGNITSQEAAEKLKAIKAEMEKLPPPAAKAGSSFKDFAKLASTAAMGVNQALELAQKAAEAFKKAYDFSKEGAIAKQTEVSFNNLVSSFQGGERVFDDVSEAAGGTIDKMTLMSSILTLTTGASENLQQAFITNADELMAIAKAASDLNPKLGDTAYMFESISSGIKRSSPLILDNLGIIVKTEEVTRKYAESLGKTTDQLSAEEKQMALLNGVLETGRGMIEQAAGAAGNAADPYRRFEAATKDLKEENKKLAAEGFRPVIEMMAEIAEGALKARAADQLLADAYQAGMITMDEYSNYQQFIVRNAAGLAQTVLPGLEHELTVLGAKWDLLNSTAPKTIDFFEQYSPLAEGAADALQEMGEAEAELTEEILKQIEERNKAITDYNQWRIDQVANFSDIERQYAEDSAEVAEELGAVQAEIAAKRAAGYSDQSKAMQDLLAKEDELIAKQAEIEAAHEQATKAIILGYMEQKLAADGILTDEEVEWLLAKGVEWGIYAENAVEAYEKASAAADEALSHFQDKTVTITVNLHNNTGLAANELPSGFTDYMQRASGGPAGGLTLLGEQGPEIVNLPAGTNVTNYGQSTNILQSLAKAIEGINSGPGLDYGKMGRAVAQAIMQMGG